MSVTHFYEVPNSRASTDIPPTITYLYKAIESTNSDSAVRVYANGATAAFVLHERGTLYRQDVKVTPLRNGIFDVEVPYAKNKNESGQYTWDFDTTGGTLHITNSKQTIASYARPNEPAPPNQGNLIGVNGDNVDGADVTIPALRLNVKFQHPEGIITIPQAKNLARWTGKVNSDTFLTFDPGEVLFLGATGSDGTEAEAMVSYSFVCQENAQGLAIGDVIVASKKGWDVTWIWYEDHEDNGKPAKRPKWVYVERVYEPIAFVQAFGFGG